MRRLFRTVRAEGEAEATRELASFVSEHRDNAARSKADRDITFDDAVERFLTEHLAGDKGRSDKTVDDYRRLHHRWFSPDLGSRPLRDIHQAALDRHFGRMRKAGLSRSRMNQARSLYAPPFRWAQARHIVTTTRCGSSSCRRVNTSPPNECRPRLTNCPCSSTRQRY